MKARCRQVRIAAPAASASGRRRTRPVGPPAVAGGVGWACSSWRRHHEDHLPAHLRCPASCGHHRLGGPPGHLANTTWTLQVNGSIEPLTISTKGGAGAPGAANCRAITGEIRNVAEVRGWYCPSTGRIHLVHTNLDSNRPVRVTQLLSGAVTISSAVSTRRLSSVRIATGSIGGSRVRFRMRRCPVAVLVMGDVGSIGRRNRPAPSGVRARAQGRDRRASACCVSGCASPYASCKTSWLSRSSASDSSVCSNPRSVSPSSPATAAASTAYDGC